MEDRKENRKEGEENRKEDKEYKNSIIPHAIAILAVFVALFGIAWTEIPELFNRRVNLPDFEVMHGVAVDADEADNAQNTQNIFNAQNTAIENGELLDGTKVSELGDRVVMSSFAYDGETYHDGHILRVHLDKTGEWGIGEVDITGNDYLWLSLHVQNDNPSEDVIAYDTSVHIEMPEDDDFSTRKVIRACVYASNAEPTDRWDDIEFYSDRKFKISYVPQSAHMYNGYFGWNYTTIPSAAKKIPALTKPVADDKIKADKKDATDETVRQP